MDIPPGACFVLPMHPTGAQNISNTVGKNRERKFHCHFLPNRRQREFSSAILVKRRFKIILYSLIKSSDSKCRINNK